MAAAQSAIEPELLSIQDLTARGFGKKTKIYAMIARGDFPEPIKIGGSSRWLVGELRAFVEARAAVRGRPSE